MIDYFQSLAKKTTDYCTKNLSANKFILIVILILATLLRFHKLTFQSLWSDEIQTMFNANPKLNWEQCFKVLRKDDGVNLPLFFIFERLSFFLFGYTDWVARALSAVAGIASVFAIFLFGKEVKNEKLGLTAAALMSVNYFCIYYSQEARMYSFLLLFTILSYLFFLKICKYTKYIDAILFVISTLCLIYVHYFGFFVVISELVIAIIFLVREQNNKKRLFAILFIVYAVILVSYIPWIPYLKSTAVISKFWIKPIQPNFIVNFFNEYFDYSSNLSWMVVVFLVIYLSTALIKFKGLKNLNANPLNLSFIFVIVSLIVSLGIPYIRSVLATPMIIPRYTIIILPSIFIAFAYGIELIPYKIIRYLFVLFFMYLSLSHLIIEKKYYTSPVKTQFRELTKYVTSNNQNYPIINELTYEQQWYYLRKNNYKGRVLIGKKENIIDSILQKSSAQYNIDTFWLESIFVDPHLSDQKQKDIDTTFIIIKGAIFYDGSAQLYARSKNIYKIIDYSYFSPESVFNYIENSVAIWSKDVTSRPLFLPKGKYQIGILSYGTPVNGVYPHNNIYINNNRIGDFTSNASFVLQKFPFEQKQDTTITIKIDMDNDTTTKYEDRNTFIRNIYILKTNDSNLSK